MKKIELAEIIKDILIKHREARNSDNVLIYAVMRYYGIQPTTPFAAVIQAIRDGNLPAFASITRAKRKVVELHPELDCDAKVRELRNLEQEEYRAFAKETKI